MLAAVLAGCGWLAGPAGAQAAGASVVGTKSVSGTFAVGGTVTYLVTLFNGGLGPQLDNPGNELTDVLPSTVTLVGASASSGVALANTGTNTVGWNGTIPASGLVTITITARVNPAAAGTTVTNQAEIDYDADGNGTNESVTTTNAASFDVPAYPLALAGAASAFAPPAPLDATAHDGPSGTLSGTLAVTLVGLAAVQVVAARRMRRRRDAVSA